MGLSLFTIAVAAIPLTIYLIKRSKVKNALQRNLIRQIVATDGGDLNILVENAEECTEETEVSESQTFAVVLPSVFSISSQNSSNNNISTVNSLQAYDENTMPVVCEDHSQYF